MFSTLVAFHRYGVYVALGFLVIPLIWISLIIFAVYQEDAKGNFGPEPIKGTDIRPAAEGGNAIKIR